MALAVFSAAFLLVRAVGSPLIDRYGGARVASLVLGVEVVGLVALALTVALRRPVRTSVPESVRRG